MMQKAIFFSFLILFICLSETSGHIDDKEAQLKKGNKVFQSQCVNCHKGGDNTIEPSKTLKLADLKKNGYVSSTHIKKIVKGGKGVMPSYKDSLEIEDIEAVSEFVWTKAQDDWK
jgi:cytochrome c6